MRKYQNNHRWLLLLFILGIVCSLQRPVVCNAAEPLPSASDVVRRIIERSQQTARNASGPEYTYDKCSLLSHLDAEGQATKSEEKNYHVTLIAGFPFERLVSIKGREMTDEELKKEEAKEEKFRQRFSSINLTNMAARKKALLTPQLLNRYDFVVKERVMIGNRSALVVTFSPKTGKLAEKAIHDKLLNRIAGTIWLDEQDAEAAKLTVHLTETLSLGWFGVLGSLSQLELSLERKRMPEGIYVNAKQTLRVQYRKLATTLRVRSTEESSGYLRAR